MFVRGRSDAVLSAGIRLSPGTYHVSPSIEHQTHLYMRCGTDREDVFEIDFTGAFFYFTVSFYRPPLSRICAASCFFHSL